MKISEYVEELGAVAFLFNRAERRRKMHKRKGIKVKWDSSKPKPKYYTEDTSPQTDRRRRRREKSNLAMRQLREKDSA